MPPELSPSPLTTPPAVHTRTRIVVLAGVVLLLAASAALLFFFFQGTSPERRFIIGDAEQGVAYLYEKGTLTLAPEPAEAAPETFSPEGGPSVAIAAEEEVITACSSAACADLFRYGIPAERPVVFDVSGNTLALISPLTSEFLAYTLHPSAPARIEPLFVAKNTVMPGVSALTKHPTKEQAFVFVESMTTDKGVLLHVCTVTHKEGDTTLTSSQCAQMPITAPLTAPFITVLP